MLCLSSQLHLVSASIQARELTLHNSISLFSSQDGFLCSFFFFERQGNNSSETQRHLPKSTQLIRDRVGLRPGCLVLACLGSVSESERSTPAQESAGRWSGVTVVGRSSGRASGDANLAAEDEED